MRTPPWDFAPSTIFSWSFAHQLPFFKASGHFLCQKTFYSKGEVKTVFKDFLASETLDFYHTAINNLVSWCIEV